MDEKNEELVDAQIVEEDSRMYGHAEGEPGGEVADEPALVLGDDEIAAGRGKVKNMETGEETEIDFSALGSLLGQR